MITQRQTFQQKKPAYPVRCPPDHRITPFCGSHIVAQRSKRSGSVGSVSQMQGWAAASFLGPRHIAITLTLDYHEPLERAARTVHGKCGIKGPNGPLCFGIEQHPFCNASTLFYIAYDPNCLPTRSAQYSQLIPELCFCLECSHNPSPYYLLVKPRSQWSFASRVTPPPAHRPGSSSKS